MQTGYRFLVSTDVLAIERRAGRSHTITVPSGSVVEVTDLRCEDDARLTEVAWEDRRLLLFGQDLLQLAKRIEPQPIDRAFTASRAFASRAAA